MSKKLILGIAAGVAALAVVGVICKRKGYLDSWFDRAEEMGHDLKDKFNDVTETARRKFDDAVHKGGDIADKISNSAENTGKSGTNPATV